MNKTSDLTFSLNVGDVFTTAGGEYIVTELMQVEESGGENWKLTAHRINGGNDDVMHLHKRPHRTGGALL